MMDMSYIDEARMEPLQLGILAALTPSDIEVVMYDDRMEKIPYDEPTDLVAITAETYTAKRTYEITKEFKRRAVQTIIGGMHPTLIPEEASLHADAILEGDAENTWREILSDAKKRKLKKRYHGQPGEPHPGIFTRRDIFKGKGYLPVSLIQFSRGCKNHCTFCASSVYFKRQHYCRKISEVIKEIEEQKLKFVFFVDDNIVSEKEIAKKLFKALIPLKIKWISQASIDMTDDLKLMSLMEKSGCIGNVIGFESIDLNNLNSMEKISNTGGTFDGYKTQVKILRDFGQQSWAAFTLGHQYDTPETIKRLLDFAIKSKFAFAAFNILMPYPNTPFYKKLEREKRLLYSGKWWLDPNYLFNHAAFKPGLMSADQLTEAAFDARKNFNSPLCIIRRAFDPKTHMRSLFRFIGYFKYNPLFRKEVYKKHGMLFGNE